MECPECKNGQLHVITMMACSCGHHSLICGGCSGFFRVECGDPYGPTKLPPEHPITYDQRLSEKMRRGLPAGDTLNEHLQKLFARLPLVEAFKESLLITGTTDPT